MSGSGGTLIRVHTTTYKLLHNSSLGEEGGTFREFWEIKSLPITQFCVWRVLVKKNDFLTPHFFFAPYYTFFKC